MGLVSEIRALICDAEGEIVANHRHPAPRRPVRGTLAPPSVGRSRREDRSRRLVLGCVNAAAVVTLAMQLRLPA